MTYIPPTSADVLARFPEFDGVPNELISAVLDEALGETDDSWDDRDRRLATLYLTAHMLSLEGWPGRISGGSSAAETATTGGVLREKVGDVEVQYAGVTSKTAADAYSQTVYGKRYFELLRRNQPAVFII